MQKDTGSWGHVGKWRPVATWDLVWTEGRTEPLEHRELGMGHTRGFL